MLTKENTVRRWIEGNKGISYVYRDCVTAMKESKHETKAGFAFWVVYDGPEYVSERFENLICKKFLESGVEIESVKSVRGRGKEFIVTYNIFL